MDERRVADYFVVAGLPECPEEMGEFSQDGSFLKPTHCLPPITDVTVIFQSFGETVPEGFHCITTTPSGHSANLSAGGWRTSDAYLCYRRGLDKPPLVDVGVIYEGKERIMADSKIVYHTPEGRPASVSSGSTNKTFVTYRRAPERMPCNHLVVTDICVIIPNKGENPPYAFRLIDKSLNKSLMGTSGVYICYKKSVHRPTLITYKPGVLARYPRTDRSYFPFPETVPMFCLPMGATVESWPAEASQPKPIFSTFVLTVSDASEKVYGSAVTFYERFPDDNLTSEQRSALRLNENTSLRSINVNKCICILSHWPFFDTFERFLKFLYEMTCDGPHIVPVERYVSYFLEDVPFPSPKRPRILVQLSATDRVVLTQPEDLPLPRSGAGFCQLLTNLGPENCMLVLLLALTEQKLLVHSLRPDVLTAVAEAISMIIFPFKWQCPYIPLCPLGLADVLHAPLPFLIGVDSRFFDLYDPPLDVTCVDLDTNSITICEERRALNLKLLPKRPARALRTTLQRLFSKLRNQFSSHLIASTQGEQPDDESIDRDFFLKRKEQELELEIQEAFLHFMASVLKGYRGYLLPITKAPTAGTTDPSSLFDLQGFMRSRDKAHHKFFALIMKTQMFIRFIEERSFVSDMDASLAFFDDCAEKVDANDESDAPLLELDDSQKSERTVFIMPPEPTGLPQGATYSYRGFVLNPLLFSQKEMKQFLGHGREPLSSAVPGSPVAKRTKHEIRSAQKLARKFSTSPIFWAKCLLGTCYSLWFIHLPSHVIQSHYKAQSLQKAYDLLVKMHKLKVQPTDEVCYRVVMQLCGLYSLPVLAVKLLFLMKRSGLQPNAITYGFYNRAVLEAAWPSDMTNSSQLLWNKLRNVIVGAALFRRAGRKSARRRLSLSADNADRVSLGGVSLESANSSSHDSAMLRASKEVLAVLPEQDRISTTAIAGSDAGYGSLCDPQSTSRGCLHEHEVGSCLSGSTSSTNDALNPELSTENTTPLPEASEFVNSVTCDQIRPRVSSIVKGGAATPLSPTLQSPFESSAGVLMSSGFDGITAMNHTVPERRPVSMNSGETISRRRHGSSGSNDLLRLRHEHRTQGTTSVDSNDCFKMLRSESFANDAQIFEKLSSLKVSMQEEDEEEDTVKTRQPIGNGPYPNVKAKLGKYSSRSESQDLEEAVMDYMSHSDSKSPPSQTSQHCQQRKYSAPSKQISSIGRSPHSPARMPVTENDPLGALNGPNEGEDDLPKRVPPSQEPSPSRSWVHTEEAAGGPVLFKDSSRHRRAKTEEEARKFHAPVMRSATYHQGLGTDEPVLDSSTNAEDADTDDCYPDDDDDGSNKKIIQRSSTLPVSPTSAVTKGVAASPSVASSLSSLSSSFKLPFRRYSPGRLSLRKPDLRLGSQMLENAQNALTHFSPGSLAGKRSNEILMNLKSAASTAATSMVKKFDEFKEVISANATPVKGTGLLSGGGGVGTREGSLIDDDDMGPEERRRTSATVSEFSPLGSVQQYTGDHWSSNFLELFSGSDAIGSRKGSATNLHPNDVGSTSSLHNLLPERLYQRREDTGSEPIAMEVVMTTCSKCHNCSSILYDEEIMAGWVPDDSNLNTKCHYCEKWMVPFLTVSILDYREQPVRQRSTSPVPGTGSTHSLQELRPSDSLHPDDYKCLNSSPPCGVRVRSKSESQLGYQLNVPIDEDQEKHSEESCEPVALEPISVPYLNPLVLRKEVENILDNEGDVALNRPHFVDDHPIIYWNLVWIFQRIDVESHLPYLSLQANTVIRNRELHSSWNEVEIPAVLVRCMWDNSRFFEEEGTPMYVLWQRTQQTRLSSLISDNIVSRATMQQVISGVKCNDLLEPLRKCVAERQKLKNRGIVRRYSVYRDILFLALGALGRENIDQVAFDEEYRIAFEKLSVKDLKMYQKCDQPLSTFAICCRHYFRDLEFQAEYSTVRLSKDLHSRANSSENSA